MSGDRIGAIVMGLVAILLGVAWISGAVGRRRRRAEIAATYNSTGGPIYSVLQLGCAGMIMILGVAFVAAGLLLRR